MKFPVNKIIVFAFMLFAQVDVNAMNKMENLTMIEKISSIVQQAKPATAVSVSVIRNNQIFWSSAFGYCNPVKHMVANTSTNFQAGSISKFATAMVVMRLVDRKKLDLYENVNKKLAFWKIPENKFTKQNPVNLAQLLSMTGGVNVDRYNGYIQGQDIPTILQILRGQPPANTEMTIVNALPGTQYFYSGGGYTIIEQLLSEVTHVKFSQLAQDLVFRPLGISQTSFAIKSQAKRPQENVAVGFINDRQVNQGWLDYPESAAAGMWSNPSDLAKISIAFMSSLSASKNTFLSKQAARKMLVRQANSCYGLGFFVDDSNKQKKLMNVSKGGATVGYRSMLVLYPYLGDGVIVMTNNDLGTKLAKHIIDEIVNYYDFPRYKSLDSLS